MVPAEIFAEDIMSTIIRYSLYLGAAFQILCMLACITMNDEHSEPAPNDNMTYSDSDECSSEQSSPGHRAPMSRARRHDKKKRR
ncbi:hypothetical protein K1T71_004671 [Dendrolimus kikuchii]|uniref:Uncharacterized protein n=1 Tax=Dendrolimus kikuchii TaxID=765133 RepID=A0ACC1D8C8_9NEOP|nr:hypothetical protein K1T71_004671 [Dendrolimus kikuchii]